MPWYPRLCQSVHSKDLLKRGARGVINRAMQQLPVLRRTISAGHCIPPMLLDWSRTRNSFRSACMPRFLRVFNRSTRRRRWLSVSFDKARGWKWWGSLKKDSLFKTQLFYSNCLIFGHQCFVEKSFSQSVTSCSWKLPNLFLIECKQVIQNCSSLFIPFRISSNGCKCQINTPAHLIFNAR